jgi:hypothetical protein
VGINHASRKFLKPNLRKKTATARCRILPKRPMTPYPHSTSISESERMHYPISDLLGIVREEINLYRDLVEHAKRNNSLLVQGNLDAILESNRVEGMLSSNLRRLEQKMTRLGHELRQAFRIPSEGFTLMKLAESLEPPIALEIRSQIILFRDLVRQLKRITQRNRKLIEKSLHYSRGLLSIFSNASSSYCQSGMFEQIPPIQPTFSQRA